MLACWRTNPVLRPRFGSLAKQLAALINVRLLAGELRDDRRRPIAARDRGFEASRAHERFFCPARIQRARLRLDNSLQLGDERRARSLPIVCENRAANQTGNEFLNRGSFIFLNGFCIAIDVCSLNLPLSNKFYVLKLNRRLGARLLAILEFRVCRLSPVREILAAKHFWSSLSFCTIKFCSFVQQKTRLFAAMQRATVVDDSESLDTNGACATFTLQTRQTPKVRATCKYKVYNIDEQKSSVFVGCAIEVCKCKESRQKKKDGQDDCEAKTRRQEVGCRRRPPPAHGCKNDDAVDCARRRETTHNRECEDRRHFECTRCSVYTQPQAPTIIRGKFLSTTSSFASEYLSIN